MTGTVDYDLHGLAGVRLLDASERDAAAVDRQLGPIRSPLERAPDIEIQFVDELETSSGMRYLGLDDVAFTDDAFLVLKGRYKSRTKVRIPIEDIGRGCRIVCERGPAQVPLLIPILNLTVLGRGALPLHAAAFTLGDRGIVATGWSKGGKTETLLGFMANGARFVGDEWVYFTPDGGRMYGIPEPIRVWKWHLDSMPDYRNAVSRGDRARIWWVGFGLALASSITAGGSRHRSFVTRTLNRVSPLLRKQSGADVPPHRLFGAEACVLEGEPQRFFFVGCHESDDITVEPIEPSEVAKRMVFSLQEEQMPFMSYYWKFRFAFPERCNELIERSRDHQRRALERVLEGKETYVVNHPYPVELAALHDAMRPYCE